MFQAKRKRQNEEPRKAGNKRRKTRMEPVSSRSFRPAIPMDLTNQTLHGLRDYFWEKFLSHFQRLSKEDAEWFNFPQTPHLNTMKIMTDNIVAQSKGKLKTPSSSSSRDIEQDTISKEIDLDLNSDGVEDASMKDNSDEIDLDFGDEEDEPINLEQSLLKKPPTKEISSGKDIFSQLSGPVKKTKKTWGPMEYAWLLPTPSRYIYVNYRWIKKPIYTDHFKRTLKIFKDCMNVTREIARLETERPPQKEHDMFMFEVNQEELAALQLNRPPGVPKKFWAQRYRLWTKFDSGVQMAGIESWFSVTPELIANHVASRCASADTIVDAFCGAGGNSIAFAKVCPNVISIDINPEAISACKHNAQLYGVEENIHCKVGDFFNVLQTIESADVFFLGPPWGGENYHRGIFDLANLPFGMSLFDIVTTIKAQVKGASFIFCLPKNCDYVQLSRFHHICGGPFEIEQNLIYGKCKMWTVYCGPFFQKPKQVKEPSQMQTD